MRPRKKIVPIIPVGKCVECKYCHSPHNKSLDGEYILGKCKKTKLSVLLSERCNEFKKT